MEDQLRISYQPFKELVIMHCAKFNNIEELARFTAIITGGKIAGLYWAEGIAFIYVPLMATTNVTAKELIENRRIYWTFVGYAPLQKFIPRVETKEKMIIPLLNLETDPFFKQVAKWLKEREHI